LLNGDDQVTAFKLSHRACTLPGADAEEDRIVHCDDVPIGRVVMIDAGQQELLWRWSCLWVGTDTNGTSETLADGLNEIKIRVTVEALEALPPDPPEWRPGSAGRSESK
jgi:hypothetical protein